MLKKMLLGDNQDDQLGEIGEDVKDKLMNRHGGFKPAEAQYKRYYVD